MPRLDSDNHLAGANHFIYVKRYMSIDGTMSSFMPIQGVEEYPFFQSITWSTMKETQPVFPLGKATSPIFVSGPTVIRGKCSFANLHVNPYEEFYDFTIKSQYNPDGSQKVDLFNDENDKKLADAVFRLYGTLNGVTTNPFDMWCYAKADTNDVNRSQLVTVLLGCMIDMSTMGKDANNQDFRIAEFNAYDYFDSIPFEQASSIMQSYNYAKYVKGLINARLQRGRLPINTIV